MRHGCRAGSWQQPCMDEAGHVHHLNPELLGQLTALLHCGRYLVHAAQYACLVT
jgi:hypothetical protein